MQHELKIWPQYFEPVAQGLKTFEVRKNDRAYQAGDTVVLREWNPEEITTLVDDTPMGKEYETAPKGYTGNKRVFRIGYVLPIDAERVVFSLCSSQAQKESE
jgi:hypothetical protein